MDRIEIGAIFKDGGERTAEVENGSGVLNDG